MGTAIVKGLTEVHHCVTYSPPRPIYGLCRVGQPLRPTLRCDLLSGNYGTSLNQGCQFVVDFLISGILTFWGQNNFFPVFPSISGIFDILNFLYFAPCIFCFFGRFL